MDVEGTIRFAHILCTVNAFTLVNVLSLSGTGNGRDIYCIHLYYHQKHSTAFECTCTPFYIQISPKYLRQNSEEKIKINQQMQHEGYSYP